MKHLTVYLLLAASVFGLRADINGDHRVDLQDFAILAEEWLMSELGPNLVANGTFNTDLTGWTATGEWDWAANDGGVAESFGNTEGNLLQSIAITSGTSYQVSFYVDNHDANAGTLEAYLGGTKLAFSLNLGQNDQSISETVIAGSSDTNIKFTSLGGIGHLVTVDDVTVKEISSADKIEKAIYDILRWDSTVSSLVSSRIYPQIIPQNTSLPAITYSQIAGPRQHTLESTDNMVPSRWQFTVVAETYSELRGISDAIRGVMDNYNGTAGTVTIQCAHFADENDLTDVMPGTDELRRYIKAIDFYINYNE